MLKNAVRWFICLYFISAGTLLFGQTKLKSTPFTYLPDETEDLYNQRIKDKMLPLNATDFIILSKKSNTAFAIERYNADLKKTWTAGITLKPGETIEAFSKNKANAYILTNRTANGIQQLTAYIFDLATGKQQESKNLLEVPVASHKIVTIISEDGSKVVACQYFMQETKIKAIAATIFDDTFKKIKEQNYSFRDIASNVLVRVLIDNAGSQYVCLLSDNSTKLTIRKYVNGSTDVKVMSVPIGGIFDGREVYVFQTVYQVTQTNILYASALCLDRNTGEFASLKLVQCDFEAGEMRFAPEFKFTPEYITVLNKNNPTGKTVTRLEDIELSELLVTPEKDVILIAEKRFIDAADNLKFKAHELHLFTYDEFLNLAWRSIIMKNQVAPREEGLSGISYKSNLHAGGLDILTLETINEKNDLYIRRINTHTGSAALPKALGLNVANDKNIAYIKTSSGWLSDKFLVAVSRPDKKSAGLQLTKLGLKF